MALCLAVSFGASAQEYNRWVPTKTEADELRGTTAHTSWSYMTKDMLILYTEGSVGISMSKGIFDYESDYSGYTPKKTAKVLVGTYVDGLLVNRVFYEFRVSQGGDIGTINGSAGKELIGFLESKCDVRFVIERFAGATLDVTIPGRGIR